MSTEIVLIFSPKDNVGTAIRELSQGDLFSAGERRGRELKCRETIPYGFKVALEDIPKGEAIIKYGEIIGRSTRPIEAGEMVHVHNIEGTRGRGDLKPVRGGKA